MKMKPISKAATKACGASLLLALGGCTIVGSDYERPELGLPDTNAVEITTEEALSAANVAWFDVYDDPELRPLIELALENNLDLQQAFARIDEARARLQTSRSLFFPRIDGSLSTAPGTPQANSNDANFTLGLLLNWEIDLFGKIRRQNEAARAQLLASQAAKNAVVTTVVREVAATWLTIRELQAEQTIIIKNIEIQQEALDLVCGWRSRGSSPIARCSKPAHRSPERRLCCRKSCNRA